MICFEVNILKKTLTLKNSNEFQHVLKKGTWFAGDLMSVYMMPNNSAVNILGIAVGKKFSKSSVRRNRVKRLVKEAYRLNELNIDTGYSIVILWKNNVDFSIVTFDLVLKDLLKCFRKAGILKEMEEINV